jgi:hypothetical protein
MKMKQRADGHAFDALDGNRYEDPSGHQSMGAKTDFDRSFSSALKSLWPKLKYWVIYRQYCNFTPVHS